MKYYLIRRTSNDQVVGYVEAPNGAAALIAARDAGIIPSTSAFYAEEESDD